MDDYNNIKDIGKDNYKSRDNQGNNQKLKNNLIDLSDNENDDFKEQYNILFESTINIDELKNMKQNPMKSSDLNLNKELAQSKRNILVNDEKQFLISRKWEYLNSDKISEINNKVELIYKQMNKNQLNSLIKSINKCNLENFYANFNPQVPRNPIGPLSSLDYLIEKTTYFSNINNINMMFNDKIKLEPYIYKYRNILGDGDCFYRGLIFSLLENIVITNNIMKLKELLILFDEKINLQNPLIEKKEYLQIIKRLNISIVSQILYYIICIMENEGDNKAYQILLKVSLYCADFDFGIIFFVRYLLYEYISSNEKKIFSKENQIDIGVLLPEDFVKDKGEENEYFFENFYSLQLMKPKSFAEKIVIYIAPFVFDCEINILIYDYGPKSFIEEKLFFSEKRRETEIDLIFRKAHYDIYYKKHYFEKYSELDTLPNIYENIEYLNHNKKEIEEKINFEKKTQIEKEAKEDEKYEKIFEEKCNIKEDIPKCLQCKKDYNHKENVFCLCNDCLISELKTQILSFYIQYLEKGNYNGRADIYSLLKNKKCSISVQQDITLGEAIFNSGYQFDNLFQDVKKTICLVCHFNIDKNNYYIELACKCRLCKKECFDKYFKSIEKGLEIFIDEKRNIKGFTPLDCKCGYYYSLNSIIHMIKLMEEKNLKSQKVIYQKYIKKYWKWKCIICGDFFCMSHNFYRLIFKDDKIDKKLLKKKTEFRHLICQECGSSQRIDIGRNLNCYFCNSNHQITDIKELDQDNKVKSDCMII